MKSNHDKIRDLLKQHDDGLSAKEISSIIGISEDSARQSLKSMLDAYIDRWVKGSGIGKGNSRFTAIWTVAEIPSHCPHPNGYTQVIARGKICA